MKSIDELLSKALYEKYSALFITPPIYEDAKSYFFCNPFCVINISFQDYKNKIKEAGELLLQGYSAYAIYNYEAGFIFENINSGLADDTIITYVFFKPEDVEEFESGDLVFNFTSESQDKYSIEKINRSITEEKFYKDISRIKNFIEEGDSYQVNYTEECSFDFSGSPEALFQSMLFNQSAEFSSFINLDEKLILSSSPELFFKIENRKISVKPMKGTIKRGVNKISDSDNFKILQSSEKNRAENVMIVDLMRNDLGKICDAGSIEVAKLFDIEKYETVFQMVSEINGELRSGITVPEVFENIFPCGSITGAPKKRTMEIINELEGYKRGLYTGAIGIILKNISVFNVAIRTIELLKNNSDLKSGRLCAGSGITWESDPENEQKETLLKADFFLKQEKLFYLFESILLENGKFFLLDEHLQRLETASEYFLFCFDKSGIRKYLNELSGQVDNSKKYKVKLILGKYGKISSEITEINRAPEEYSIMISSEKINSQDKFIYYKTSKRNLFESELLKAGNSGFDEVIFSNEKNEITEGSFTNIFIKNKGKWITPSLECGLLDGIYRRKFIDENNVQESLIFAGDVLDADEVLLTNSVRKEIKVVKISLQ